MRRLHARHARHAAAWRRRPLRPTQSACTGPATPPPAACDAALHSLGACVSCGARSKGPGASIWNEANVVWLPSSAALPPPAPFSGTPGSVCTASECTILMAELIWFAGCTQACARIAAGQGAAAAVAAASALARAPPRSMIGWFRLDLPDCRLQAAGLRDEGCDRPAATRVTLRQRWPDLRPR